LNLDVYGSAYEALSLSISFQAGKVYSDFATSVDMRKIGIQQAQANANSAVTTGLSMPSETTPRYVARMVMMQATEIQIAEGSCDKKQVYYPAGVARAFVQGKQVKAEHGAPQSQLQRY
jgi:hypothetical protein